MIHRMIRSRSILQIVSLAAVTIALAGPVVAEPSDSSNAGYDPASILADASPSARPAVPASSKLESGAKRTETTQVAPDGVGLTPNRPIPEPGSLMLAAVGAAAFLGIWRRGRHAGRA
jgi:hypothetical protein